MNEKKELDDLTKIFAAGDAWLRKYGMVDNPIVHNNIVLNLYMNFPKVKYVEYFMNPKERSIEVVMHYGFWYLLFHNKDELIDQVIDLLKEYLHNFDITVKLKRFKKGSDAKTT